MHLQRHSQRHPWSKTNTEEATEERSLGMREIMRRREKHKAVAGLARAAQRLDGLHIPAYGGVTLVYPCFALVYAIGRDRRR